MKYKIYILLQINELEAPKVQTLITVTDFIFIYCKHISVKQNRFIPTVRTPSFSGSLYECVQVLVFSCSALVSVVKIQGCPSLNMVLSVT